MSHLLTVRQVCERLHLSKPTVYELLNSGQLKSLTIGRSRRIPEDVLDEFVAERLTADGAR